MALPLLLVLRLTRARGHFLHLGLSKYSSGCSLVVVPKLTEKENMSPVVPAHLSDKRNMILGHMLYL